MLYQNDDYGKDYLNGLRAGLGDKADKMIVATQSYETTDPTVDLQIVALQASGANVLFIVAIPKFAAQAIRKPTDIGWQPTRFLKLGRKFGRHGDEARRAGEGDRWGLWRRPPR